MKDEDGTGEDGEKKYIYYTLLAPADYEEKKGDFEYLSGYIGGYIDKNYYIDVERTYAAFGAEIDALVEEGKDEENPENSLTKETACHDFFVSKAQDNVVKTYQTEVTDRMSFGWIKNIWVTDASYKHPVLDYSGFKGGVSNEKLNVDGKKVKFNSIGSYTDAYNDTSYNVVTAKLGAQKKTGRTATMSSSLSRSAPFCCSSSFPCVRRRNRRSSRPWTDRARPRRK